jgi:hypothetical protein
MTTSYGYFKDHEDLGYKFRTGRTTLADIRKGIRSIMSRFVSYSCGAILVNEQDRTAHSEHNRQV